jgi:chromosome segregation ATPase
MSAARSSVTLRSITTWCVVGLALLACSCEEHKRIASQVADIRIELDTVQKAIAHAEREQSRFAKEDGALRSELPLRLGTEMVMRKVAAFEAEVEELKKRKASLEAALPELKSDYEAYRKKYL